MDARTHDRYVERAMWPIGRGDLKFWISVIVLSAFVIAGFYAYIYQLQRGLGVTGLNQKVSWGFYIINCVFFIGISYGGAMTSAILRLTNAKWRAPLTRLAEVLAVDRLAGRVAVLARALVGLDLEQLEHLRPFVGGGHHLQTAVAVGQQQAHGAGVDEVGGVRGDHLQELDQVELVHKGVGDLHEHLGQLFR